MGSIWDYYNTQSRTDPELGRVEQELLDELDELGEQQESDEQLG
ncbi:hypothetical protein ACGF13_09390 [Kitasatospora sp. NPDC048286]